MAKDTFLKRNAKINYLTKFQLLIENFINKREGVYCYLSLAAFPLTAPSCYIILADVIKILPDKFNIDPLSSNAKTDHCFAPKIRL